MDIKHIDTSRLLDWVIKIICVAMVLYHMISTQYAIHGAYEHQDFHLGFALILIFLSALRSGKKRIVQVLFIGGALLSLLATGYIRIFMDHLEEVVGYPGTTDMVIGMMLVFLVIEATRLAWGIILPIVTLTFVLYFFLGHLIPGPLHHSPFAFTFVISYLDIGFQGIFGTFLSISANYVFLFVVFGSLMGIAKIEDFFFEVGKLAGKFLAGGPAQTAVVSSGLMGMVTGAAVANVTMTGAFTIPLMKKVGYKPETAGAIEASASTGGQIMPPIMGAAAFLMASFLDLPYVEIMIAAIIPALLYYLCVGLGVQLIALKRRIRRPPEAVDKILVLKRFPLFIFPLTVLVVLLLMRYTPMYAGFWAIVTTLIFSLVWNPLMGQKPYTLRELIHCLHTGALSGAKIGIALACVGLIAQTLITTNLGTKIVGLVESLSGGNLWATLILTMALSLFLGCGVPTTAAYSLVAIIVIPVLVRQGVTDISAHFFAFYFAIISALTPPVALASLAGAAIARANYFSTAVEGFKLALSGFVIPYLIIFNPVLILRPINAPWAILSLVAIPIGLASLTFTVYGYFFSKTSIWERALLILTCIGLFGYSATKNYFSFFLGIITFLLVYLLQRKKRIPEENLEALRSSLRS
jgi:TRAP transporter 4TM/12TM fusion protein